MRLIWNAKRFYWSLRGLQAVLFSLQIGFRLCGDRFCLDNCGKSLKSRGDLLETDQRWGGDHSATGCWLVAKWFLSLLRSFTDLSAHYSINVSQKFKENTSNCGLLAIQGFSQYCLRHLHLNHLYIITAKMTASWWILCNCCNCQHLDNLKTNDSILKGNIFTCICIYRWSIGN